jgi:hypothetical protein
MKNKRTSTIGGSSFFIYQYKFLNENCRRTTRDFCFKTGDSAQLAIGISAECVLWCGSQWGTKKVNTTFIVRPPSPNHIMQQTRTHKALLVFD